MIFVNQEMLDQIGVGQRVYNLSGYFRIFMLKAYHNHIRLFNAFHG